jgi:hypothetical protein
VSGRLSKAVQARKVDKAADCGRQGLLLDERVLNEEVFDGPTT